MADSFDFEGLGRVVDRLLAHAHPSPLWKATWGSVLVGSTCLAVVNGAPTVAYAMLMLVAAAVLFGPTRGPDRSASHQRMPSSDQREESRDNL